MLSDKDPMFGCASSQFNLLDNEDSAFQVTGSTGLDDSSAPTSLGSELTAEAAESTSQVKRPVSRQKKFPRNLVCGYSGGPQPATTSTNTMARGRPGRKPANRLQKFMVGCGRCDDWFHGDCVGLDLTKVHEMEEEDQMYVCLKCCEEESKKWSLSPRVQPNQRFQQRLRYRITSCLPSPDQDPPRLLHQGGSDLRVAHGDPDRRQSTDVRDAAHKTGAQKSKTQSSASKKPVSVEAIRRSVRDSLKEILIQRLKESDMNISVERACEVAKKTERELFHLYKDTDNKYKNKYRSLMFNLKDTKNNVLFKRVLKGEISPSNLIRMSPEELASKELAAWRQRENRHAIEMIEKEQREAERRPITKITHKAGFSSKCDRSLSRTSKNPEKKTESTKTEKDTTNQHKSHLFDLHCKICTGRMAPPVEEAPTKVVKDLPDSIQVGGRISPQTVWDYLEKIRASGTKKPEQQRRMRNLPIFLDCHTQKEKDKPLNTTEDADEPVTEAFEEPSASEETNNQEPQKPLRFLPGVLVGWGGELPPLPDVGGKFATTADDAPKTQPALKTEASTGNSKSLTAAAPRERFVIKKKEAKLAKAERSSPARLIHLLLTTLVLQYLQQYILLQRREHKQQQLSQHTPVQHHSHCSNNSLRYLAAMTTQMALLLKLSPPQMPRIRTIARHGLRIAPHTLSQDLRDTLSHLTTLQPWPKTTSVWRSGTVTHGRGHETQRTETNTGGMATTGTPIMGKRAVIMTGRKSMTAATTTSTETGAGTTDIQMTVTVRRGKRGTTVMTTAAVTGTDTDTGGTLTMRMDGEVQKTVTHNYVVFVLLYKPY
ncbi:hypothetical protein INR49_009885 [Caranx melampygus]|nr:hypothetical protein INR49_009885 [Caranx melampygus]